MIRKSADTHDNACMLNRTVRIKQQRPDHTDIRAQRVRQHSVEPVFRYDFNIIIEKQQHITIGGFSSDIVQFRPVEGNICIDDGEMLEFFQVRRATIDSTSLQRIRC